MIGYINHDISIPWNITNKNEETIDTWSDVDESQNTHSEWNKLDQTKNILFDAFYIAFHEMQTDI